MLTVGSYARVKTECLTSEGVCLRQGDILHILETSVGKILNQKDLSNPIVTFRDAHLEALTLPQTRPGEKLFIALEDFIPQESGDLRFSRGNVIIGEQQLDPSWWRGRALYPGGHSVLSESGVFPLTFVVPAVEEENPATSARHDQNKDPLSKALTKPRDPHRPAAKLRARATVDCTGQLDEELSFCKGDVLVLNKKVDEVYFEGELNGKVGLVVSSLVEIFPDNTEDVEKPGEPKANTAETSDQKPTYCKAKFAFSAENPEEVSFTADEKVVILKQLPQPGWVLVRLVERTPVIEGLAPELYLQKAEEDRTNSCNTNGFSSAETKENQLENKTEAAVYGRALFDFLPESHEDLPLNTGDTVTILQHVDHHWIRAKNDSGMIGICPVGYLEVFGDDPSSVTFDIANDSSSQLSVKQLTRSNTETELKSKHPQLSRRQTYDPLHPPPTFSSSAQFLHGRNEKAAPARPMRPSARVESTTKPSSTSRPAPRRPPPPRVARAQGFDEEQGANSGGGGPEFVQHSASQHFDSDNSVIDKQLLMDRIGGERPGLQRMDSTESENRERGKQKEKMDDKKRRVIEELIATERKYIEDLEICMRIFLAEDSRPSVDVSILFGNMQETVDVSHELLTKLEKMEGIDENERCFGKCFLEMANAMKLVYAPYCRNQSDVQTILENYEKSAEVIQWMESGIEKMKKETNVFDLKSVLIKPVQRILKYPLLLQELLKNTSETHPDKVTLQQAIHVMNEVAQEINEIKRRKDVVTRYQQEDASLTEKISKLNMHSVKKKSSRVTQKISQGLGASERTIDEVFDRAEQDYLGIDQMVHSLQRDISSANNQLIASFSNLQVVVEDLSDVFGDASSEKGDADHFQRVIRNIIHKLLQEYNTAINDNVLNPLSDLQYFLASPQKLVQKRHDKLLDCDRLRNKANSIEPNTTVELFKIKALQKDLEDVKKTYDALNTQLKDEMPKLCDAAQTIINNCLTNYVNFQRTLFQQSRGHLMKIALESEMGAACLNSQSMATGVTTTALVVERFLSRHFFTVEHMQQKVGFIPSNFASVTGSSIIKEDSPDVRSKSNSPPPAKVSFGATRGATVKIPPQSTATKTRPASMMIKGDRGSATPSPTPPSIAKQSDNAKVFLKSRYPPDKLFFVILDFMARETMDISVTSQTLVGVIKDKDPLGGCDRWFVDTGEAKGFLPANILCKVQTTAVEPSAPDPCPSQLEDLVSISQPENLVSINDAHCTQLIDLEQTVNNSGDQLASDDVLSECETEQREAGQNPYYCNLEEISRPTEEPEGEKAKPTEPVMEKNDQDTVIIYRVLYSFGGMGSNTLSIEKDDIVELIKNHDQEGNREWWLVKNVRSGCKGYVPANYLKFLRAR